MSNFKDLDVLFEKYINDGLPGLGCIVSKDNKVLYEKYYGYSDIEKGKKTKKDTLYKLFSLTKVIVATAGMMLYERGKFLLNEPLYYYIPEFKDVNVVKMHSDGTYHLEKAKNPILIKHLFTMTSGYGYDFYGNIATDEMRRVRKEFIKANKTYTLLDEMRAIAKAPIKFEPGTEWMYGYGLDFVGALIEVITGDTLGQFLKKEIFNPLEMNSTSYRLGDNDIERMATIYNLDDKGNFTRNETGEIPEFEDFSRNKESHYEQGGLGLISTVSDYSKFAQMLACGGMYNGEKIIGRKTIELMRTNQLSKYVLKESFTDYPYNEGYGYGYGVKTLMEQTASNSSLGEFGWSGMLGGYVSIDPSEKLSIVYMQQTKPSNEEYYHPRIKNIVNGCI